MKILLVTAALAFPAVLAAQTDSAATRSTLSLSQALRTARHNNAAYQQVLNDAGAANWRVRDAYAAFLPSFDVTGFLGYRGPGTQTFLTTTFEQSSATVSSSYSATLRWRLSGTELTAPGLERARRDAVDADIDAAERALETQVTRQYLAVLQAQANLAVQQRQLERNEESLRLAQGRFEVGQVTRIDVQQATVARGQAEVELLRLEQLVRVERLRLFRVIGVEPDTDVMSVDLVDELPITEPPWDLAELLRVAEERHPELIALDKREAAARWGVRSARSQYLPSVAVSAGWSGFTQQFTNPDPLISSTIAGERNDVASAFAACQEENDIRTRLASPLPPKDCSGFTFTDQDALQLEQAIRDRNSVFPFDFTQQPFQVSLVVSIPIFNGFQRAIASSQASAAREDAELALEDRARELKALITERFHDVDRAYRTVAIQRENQAAASDQLELGTERYRLGQGSFFELLDSQLIAQQAERDYVNSIYDYQQSVVLLEQAVGTALR